MLLSVKLSNCFAYEDEIEFSMRADMRQKRFASNVISGSGANAVKSALIIGPNNAGKTNFVRCINGIKGILLNQGFGLEKNMFIKEEISRVCVEFTEDNAEYSFEIRMNLSKSEYLYERLTEITYDRYKNRKEKNIYIRDTLEQQYVCDDDELKNLIKVVAKNNLLIYLIDTSKFDALDKAKKVLTSFASKIDVVDMNNIPIKKTIDMMKLSNDAKKKIVDFVLSADLSMEDFRYLSDDEIRINMDVVQEKGNLKPQENALTVATPLMEMLHLSSVYHGISVPSILFDSTGTKKIASLASYIIDALEKGKILVVDELDNSLHSRLSRAIISLFNNDLNRSAQLICTVHDVTLLDCKKLFRKEQIWFAHKDKDGVYLYSLAEFTAEKYGVRDTTDLIGRYRSGVFGAFPEPDLFKTLQEVRARMKRNVEQALDEADEYAEATTERLNHEEVFGKLRRRVNGEKSHISVENEGKDNDY